MKFAYTKDLEQFIRDNHLFPDLVKFTEICVGGASYNFDIETAGGRYFLKLLEEKGKNFEKIKYLCNHFNLLYPTDIEQFMNYKIIVMSYIKGKKMRRNCSAELIHNLCLEYQKMQACQLKPEFIFPPKDIMQLKSEISAMLEKQTSFIYRFIAQIVWPQMTQSLTVPAVRNSLIHGDFTANNVLVADNDRPYILDWEQLRYGNGAEDWAGLILELSGFRGLCGSAKTFKRLFNEIARHLSYSAEEWQHGVHMFYFSWLRRKLENIRKQSLRKQICALICLLGYFRVIKILRQVI